VMGMLGFILQFDVMVMLGFKGRLLLVYGF
jgi:hypothetical protein